MVFYGAVNACKWQLFSHTFTQSSLRHGQLPRLFTCARKNVHLSQ